MNIYIIGNITFDVLNCVDVIPSIEEGSLVKNRFTTFGGRGANIAVALAKLGMHSKLYSVAGKDYVKVGYKRYLYDLGIDVSNVKVITEKSCATVDVYIKNDGRYLYFFQENAQKYFANIKFDKKIVSKQDLIFITPGDEKTILKILKNRLKGTILFGLGEEIYRMDRQWCKTILEKTSFLFTNKKQSVILLKKLDYHSNVDLILKNKNLRCLFVTRGKDGSTIYFKDGSIKTPAVKPNNIRSGLGCGDAYIAGVILGLTKGFNYKQCSIIGATLSSFALESFGSQESLPDFRNLRARLRKNFPNEHLFGI